MNELVEADFGTLIDEVNDVTRPQVAELMDLIDSYERGDFSRGWADIIDPALFPTMSKVALQALVRIYRYGNELTRLELHRLQTRLDIPGD